MNLQELLAAFTWRDGLDFGLLVLVSYGLLRLVRRTRALPVLLALALLGLVAWVVRWLDLIGIASLLRAFFEYFIIILIVVFRQELRRGLLALGQRLMPGARHQAGASSVEEILLAVDRLLRGGVGGMFVLQGNLDVTEATPDPGREVDAPVRADLLVALAAPHPVNSLHDGAILIDDPQIRRAGIVCPLTRTEGLDPRFGTRHRAAVGLSEETDALVIVLSEERGEARVAEGGAISEPLDAARIQDRILAWQGRPRGPSSGEEGMP